MDWARRLQVSSLQKRSAEDETRTQQARLRHTERREKGQEGVHGSLGYSMGKSNPVPGAQQPPTSAWEDVGPRDNRRTFTLWRSRHRGPVDPSNVELPVVAGALDHPGADDPDNDRGLTTCTSTRSFGKAVGCAQVSKGECFRSGGCRWWSYFGSDFARRNSIQNMMHSGLYFVCGT